MSRTIRRWRAWARSHRARYQAPRRGPGQLALTLRRSMTAPARNEHRHRVTLSWAPRVELHLQMPEVNRIHIHVLRGALRPAPQTARTARGWYAVSRVLAAGSARANGRDLGDGRRPSQADRPARDVEARRAADRLAPLQRVLARTSRFAISPDRVAAPRAMAAPVRLALREGKRVELRRPGVAGVLHSPKHERTPEAPVEAGLRTAMTPPAPPARGSIEAALIDETSVNVLTERVIRQIDRRIVAYRERLGRPA